MPAKNSNLQRDALAKRAKALAEQQAARTPSEVPKLEIEPIGSYTDDFGRKAPVDQPTSR